MSDPTHGDPSDPQDPQGEPARGPDASPPSYGPPPYGQAPPPPPPTQQPPYGPPGPSAYGPPPGQPAMLPGQLTADERTWGGAAHWSALIAGFLGLAFLGPLLVMLTKGNESGYIRAQAVESLNFQLSMLIYIIVAFVTIIVLIGFLLAPIVAIAWLVLTIVGSVKSADGELYRYPLTIRMVS